MERVIRLSGMLIIAASLVFTSCFKDDEDDTVIKIGKKYQGGVVAYILQPGDTGYVAGETHGLIAATEDQSTDIVWSVPAYTTTAVGGTGTALGTGSANTDLIIAQNGAGTGYAAGLARAYNGGGYTDWYLPSRDELIKLYDNRDAIGGFDTSEDYWTSSEYTSIGVWLGVFMPGGGNAADAKSRLYPVRAVRSF